MSWVCVSFYFFFFFFNDTATTEIYTLSLHDALPIRGSARPRGRQRTAFYIPPGALDSRARRAARSKLRRSPVGLSPGFICTPATPVRRARDGAAPAPARSEERRVGKECR